MNRRGFFSATAVASAVLSVECAPLSKLSDRLRASAAITRVELTSGFLHPWLPRALREIADGQLKEAIELLPIHGVNAPFVVRFEPPAELLDVVTSGGFSNKVFWELGVEKAQNPTGLVKLLGYGASYLRDRARELDRRGSGSALDRGLAPYLIALVLDRSADCLEHV